MNLSGRLFYRMLLVIESLRFFFSYLRTAVSDFIFAALLFAVLEPKTRRPRFLFVGPIFGTVGMEEVAA